MRLRHSEPEDNSLLANLERSLPIMSAIAQTQLQAHEVLDIALESATAEEAAERLVAELGWTPDQAHAALEMQFRFATADKCASVAQEVADIEEHIARLRGAIED